MILDKKLNGILSQEDRALKIFEPSDSDLVYEVCSFSKSFILRNILILKIIFVIYIEYSDGFFQ